MTALPPTPLERAPVLEAALDLPVVWLKRDDQCETGFHKFRAAWHVCRFLAANGVRNVAVASCGSYAVSVLRVATEYRLNVHVFLAPAPLPVVAIAGLAASQRSFATYEAAVDAAAAFALSNDAIDISPGGWLASLIRYALGRSAFEVFTALGGAPSAIFCPVGNGSTLAGVFEALACRKETHKLPKLFGVGLQSNPLVHTPARQDADADIRLEPLRSAVPLDAQGATAGVLISRGNFVSVKRAELELAQESLAQSGVAVSLAGAAAVAGLIRHRSELAAADTRSIVCILTAGAESL